MPAKPQPTARHKPTVARFLLDAPVLPLVTDTLRVAEAFRNAAMSHFRRWCRRNPALAEPFRRTDQPGQFASPTLSGKESSGAIRKDHRHACYLPTADGDDPRRLTHVTVTAGEGFGPGEVAALNGVRTLKLAEESAELRVQLVGLGDRQDFRVPLLGEAQRLDLRHAVRGDAAIPSCAARSATAPRIMPRRETSCGIYFSRSCSAGRTCRRSRRSRTKSTLAGIDCGRSSFNAAEPSAATTAAVGRRARSASRSPFRCVVRSSSATPATLASGFLSPEMTGRLPCPDFLSFFRPREPR